MLVYVSFIDQIVYFLLKINIKFFKGVLIEISPKMIK